MSNVLEKLHQVQTEMALEIDRVCKKHDIKYFIVAGTLLGAVRHKGFIPWDDDLDIGMLRKEYDKFIKVAKTELNKNYYLQTWDSDSGFGWPFAKLRKKNTTFIEANSLDTTAHQGIFVDIFPFDNVPVSSLKKKQHNLTALVLKKALLLKQGYTIWDEKDTVKKYAHLILKSASKPINAETIKRTLYKEMTKYNLHQSNYVVNFGGAYGYSQETIDYAWVETLDTIEFDGYALACPNDTDAYLTHMYGDYMTPPPEEKRYNRHNIIEVKF